MMMDPVLPSVQTFKGEGYTRFLRPGPDAVAGVRAHEANNIRTLKRQAERNGFEVIDSQIKVQTTIGPDGKPQVVGGTGSIRYRETNPQTSKTQALPQNTTPEPQTDQEALQQLSDLLVVEKQRTEAQVAKLQHELDQAEPGDSDQKRAALEEQQRKLQELRAAVRETERQKQLQFTQELLGNALDAQMESAGKLIAAGYGPPQHEKSPRVGPRGVFLPAFTMSGLLVNGVA